MQRPMIRFILLGSAVTLLCVPSRNLRAQVPTEASTPVKKATGKAHSRTVSPEQVKHPVLWEDPGNIAAKDLFLGSGGTDHQPEAPFTFISEDSSGTNPKFDVRDGDGKKWRVKLGSEARPETVAARLLWAMGYFTDTDYLLPSAQVANLKLRRGQNQVQGTTITDGRFERKPGKDKKLGDWRWKDNPFKGTQAFNGLRVMMAVMNNWDLKDVNNSIYQDPTHDRQVFLVSDIGATFASNDEHVYHNTDKGNLESFEKSKFITKKTDTEVSFGTPMLPAGLILRRGPFLLPEALRRSAIDWIGHDIPLKDARWIGGMLGQLSHQQLEDAFRAGNFPESDREAFVKIVEDRIAALKAL